MLNCNNSVSSRADKTCVNIDDNSDISPVSTEESALNFPAIMCFLDFYPRKLAPFSPLVFPLFCQLKSGRTGVQVGGVWCPGPGWRGGGGGGATCSQCRHSTPVSCPDCSEETQQILLTAQSVTVWTQPGKLNRN